MLVVAAVCACLVVLTTALHYELLRGLSAALPVLRVASRAKLLVVVCYGDVIPMGDLRLLAGVESLNGLLLIGWSASYTYIAMERFWSSRP